MPSLVRGKSVGSDSNLRCHHGLEFVVGDFEESKQLAYQHADVALVDESKTEIERTSTNTDVRVAQTIQDGVAMSLNSVWLNCDDLVQSVECDVSDVVVSD